MGEMGKSYKRSSFLVNPNLLWVVLIYLILVTAVYYYVLSDDLETLLALDDVRLIVESENFGVIAVMAAIYIINLLIIYWCSEQYFGLLSIKTACIILHRPLKFSKRIRFDEIQSIGVDIGTTGAFWIYISSRNIPFKYHNKINRLTPKRGDIVFAYSDRAYDSLCAYLPKDLRKKLAASRSIFRLYE